MLDPEVRWVPGEEERGKKAEDLLPPLVPMVRRKVKEWRESGYAGASATSKALLRWWFVEPHFTEKDGVLVPFRFYFAQREAVESVIYLHEVAGVRDKVDLIRFDTTGRLAPGMFAEDWPRLVLKMATGSGKTKVLALLVVWSYFHKLYEEDSPLSRNFLVIAPNIIVLERLRHDFDGLNVFFSDPMLPENGYEGRDWQSDFQPKLHLQDEVRGVSRYGNIFLTNIHRVYTGHVPTNSSGEEYFLGPKPVGKTTERLVDLGEIVRGVDEIMVLNDEAHHIHDEKLAWFQAIADIASQLKLKGKELSLQVDVTATPRGEKGRLFPQVICDYPLVEAIHQGVVKHPVLPDAASRAKLKEAESANFIERYQQFLHIGYLEWKKSFEEHGKIGKKAVLFVMTDDTTNCDTVAKHLEVVYPDLRDRVLTIHTNKSGDIVEGRGKKDIEELRRLREEASNIDGIESRHRAVVSVLMLKEGWDVRNVTTIVGLRSYSSKSNILPEQTLGRGLRLMYFGQGVPEEVAVVGTPAFMDFVESIKREGVELTYRRMDLEHRAVSPVIVEVDAKNEKKDLDSFYIEIPVLTPRLHQEYRNLAELDAMAFAFLPVTHRTFSESELRKIVFRKVVSGEVSHELAVGESAAPDYRNVLGWFTKEIMRDLHLVSGHDILFEKIREFAADRLFGERVALDDPQTIKNLSEPQATKIIIETFKREIGKLTVVDKGGVEVRRYIRLSETKPFVARQQEYLLTKKSVFNRFVGDSGLEYDFARFLDGCSDILSFAKNHETVGFKIEYRTAGGGIATYQPDFVVKKDSQTIVVIETKGREDVEDPGKIERLAQWCVDASSAQKRFRYEMIYVPEELWEKYKSKIKNFAGVASVFSGERPKRPF